MLAKLSPHSFFSLLWVVPSGWGFLKLVMADMSRSRELHQEKVMFMKIWTGVK